MLFLPWLSTPISDDDVVLWLTLPKKGPFYVVVHNHNNSAMCIYDKGFTFLELGKSTVIESNAAVT